MILDKGILTTTAKESEEVLEGLALVFLHLADCSRCHSLGVNACQGMSILYATTLVHLGVDPKVLGLKVKR